MLPPSAARYISLSVLSLTNLTSCTLPSDLTVPTHTYLCFQVTSQQSKEHWKQSFTVGYVEQGFKRLCVEEALRHGEENEEFLLRQVPSSNIPLLASDPTLLIIYLSMMQPCPYLHLYPTGYHAACSRFDWREEGVHQEGWQELGLHIPPQVH